MCGFLLSSNVETNLNNFDLCLKEINHRGPDSNNTLLQNFQQLIEKI